MTSQETELYARIEAFTFDEGVPEMSFGARLARDNGWGTLYALRVLEEYRRFVFLIVASGHLAVPSDQVDQAWHQHLQYTRSWSDFCQNVSLQPIDHQPARGGPAEAERFKAGYVRTIESYRRYFSEPPDDIWPAAARRFGRDLHFRRVNTEANVVIPWYRLVQLGTAAVAVFGAVFFAWMS